MYLGNKKFDVKHHTYVMGILNVTPYSFSDGGNYQHMDQALYRAEEMIAEGADLIDLGGESSRPGHTAISEQEELERVLPVLERLRQNFDIPLSLDTCKSSVAQAGISVGVDMINDIWGLKKDDKMQHLIAQSGVVYCLMHNRRETIPSLTVEDFLLQVQEDIQCARSAGIREEQIVLDPGIGFAKTQEQNLMILGNLERWTALGYPVLLGASRKSVIGHVLDLPTEQRLEGTLATTATAVMSRCGFVRVHDVKENVRFIQMMEQIRAQRSG